MAVKLGLNFGAPSGVPKVQPGMRTAAARPPVQTPVQTPVRILPAVLAAIVAAALAGCASVSVRVLETNPAVRYAPTTHVEVLFEPPQRPYVEIAMLEAEGDYGVSEIKLLEDLRDRARTLGADAIVRTGGQQWYQPPSAVYDPLYDPFFFPRRIYPYHPFGPPYGGYRWVGGGYFYTAQAAAIKYQPAAPQGAGAAPAAAANPTR